MRKWRGIVMAFAVAMSLAGMLRGSGDSSEWSDPFPMDSTIVAGPAGYGSDECCAPW